MHELEPPVFHTFGIPHHVAFGWLVMAILIGVAYLVPRRPALVPRGVQNAVEAVLEFVLSLIDDVIGREGRRFLPLIATLGLFIFASNLLGLVPGFTAPTDNVNTNLACALVVFFSYHWIGIRAHGLWAYLKHFAGPMPALAPLMVPIELISHLARPLSLTLRLFGNMLGGHILLSIVFFMTVGLSTWALSSASGLIGLVIGSIGTVVTILFTVGFLFPLKLLVAFLQAFIFCMLSMLYIAGALEAEHGEESGHGASGGTITRDIAATRPRHPPITNTAPAADTARGPGRDGEGGEKVRSLSCCWGCLWPPEGVAYAADAAATGSWVGPFTVMAAGIGMALAAGLCGLGQARAIAAALDAMARQPGAAARIQTAMIIGLALIESLAIYVLVIAIILLFAKPFK